MRADDEGVLLSYRAVSAELAPRHLDAPILEAARARSRLRRRLRRTAPLFGLAAVGLVLGLSLTGESERRPLTVTNYGVVEGLTRGYLLEASPVQIDAPESSGSGLRR